MDRATLHTSREVRRVGLAYRATTANRGLSGFLFHCCSGLLDTDEHPAHPTKYHQEVHDRFKLVMRNNPVS